MIQLVSKRPLPFSRQGRRLTDPDLLLTIAERIRSQAPDRRADADKFNLVLGDMRIAGTWKRTSSGRLTRTQDEICKCVVRQSGVEVSVLDIGASEGLTTVELAAALRKKFGGARLHLGDISIWLYRFRKGPVREYRGADGEPIMVKVGRVGLRLSRQRYNQPQEPDPIAALYLRCKSFRASMQQDARISLVHPLVWDDPAITVKELNCLVCDNSLCLGFDAVRASNVLNAGYFSRPQIDTALGNIHAYLREGGCLVISRNRGTCAGETEDGSVWRKAEKQFSHVSDFGAGSEIRTIVDHWHLSTT
jgi:hypothetical protein